MNKEPELELEPEEEEALNLVKPQRRSPAPPGDGQSSPEGPLEAAATTEGDAADGVRQMLPSHSPSNPPPTRFSTAAPLAPPRPNQTGAPSRPSNVPPAPRLPAAQAVEKIAELQERSEERRVGKECRSRWGVEQ